MFIRDNPALTGGALTPHLATAEDHAQAWAASPSLPDQGMPRRRAGGRERPCMQTRTPSVPSGATGPPGPGRVTPAQFPAAPPGTFPGEQMAPRRLPGIAAGREPALRAPRLRGARPQQITADQTQARRSVCPAIRSSSRMTVSQHWPQATLPIRRRIVCSRAWHSRWAFLASGCDTVK